MNRVLKTLGMVLAILLVGHFVAYKMFHVPQRLEFVLIFVAFLFYPIIRNPIVGVYTVFIFGPFIPFIRRIYYLVYTRPGIDPLIVIDDAILVLIMLGLFFSLRRSLGREKGVAVYVRVIICYFVYCAVRSVFLNDQPLSVSIPCFKNYGPAAIFFLVGIVYADAIAHLKRLWTLTIVIGIAALAYGINQLYFGYSKAERLWFASVSFSSLFIGGVARPFSFFQAPVVFADYMQLAIVAVLMAVEWSRVKTSAVLLALVPFFFYGSLITSVRSSWAGVLVAVVVWYTVFRVKGTGKRIAVAAVVVGLYMCNDVIGGIMGKGFNVESVIRVVAHTGPNKDITDRLVSQRTSALTDPLAEHSFLARTVMWKYILDTSVMPVNAVFGHGTGAMNADSLYFTYLGEFGYPGLIFIIWILVAFLRTGFYVIDNEKDRSAMVLAKGVTLINLVFAIISIAGTHIHYFPGDVYFWFFNGVLVTRAAAIRRQIKEETHEAPAYP